MFLIQLSMMGVGTQIMKKLMVNIEKNNQLMQRDLFIWGNIKNIKLSH